MQVPKFSIACPKWALPREEIPVHVKIDKSVTRNIKNAILSLPDCFELIDTINISKHDLENNQVVVKNIGKANMSEYDYFGITIATREPFDELKKQIPIDIQFNLLDGTVEKFTTYARIFRPLLEFEDSLKNITLTDNPKDDVVLPISLKFTGFGEINLRSECKIDGKIVSTGTSVVDEVLQRLLKEGFFKDEKSNSEAGLSINEEYIHNVTDEIKKEFLKDDDIRKMLESGQIDEDSAQQLYELNREEQEKLVNIFYKTVEGYLIKIISDILKRNVSNNLQLESQTKIHTLIKIPITDITIRFFYKDIVGNEYAPIEQKIQIVDKRTNPSGFKVEIPVEITKVDESNAYKNVGSMAIGTNR